MLFYVHTNIDLNTKVFNFEVDKLEKAQGFLRTVNNTQKILSEDKKHPETPRNIRKRSVKHPENTQKPRETPKKHPEDTYRRLKDTQKMLEVQDEIIELLEE